MPEYTIVVLGTAGVGKSSLVVRFVQGFFVEHYDPTIEDTYRKTYEFCNEHHMLNLIDTAGTDDFPSMRELYVKTGHGFVLVYCIDAPSTYQKLADFRAQIVRIKDREDVPMVIAGNKHDLVDRRLVTEEEGQQLAVKFGAAAFFETSAKSNYNVGLLFESIVKSVVAHSPPVIPEATQKHKSMCILI